MSDLFIDSQLFISFSGAVHYAKTRLNAGKFLNCIWVVLDEVNQQRSLCVGLRSALFPVFQSAYVCPQIDREERAGKLQILANTNQFLWCKSRRWLEFHRMSSESSLAFSRVCESIQPFA